MTKYEAVNQLSIDDRDLLSTALESWAETFDDAGEDGADAIRQLAGRVQRRTVSAQLANEIEFQLEQLLADEDRAEDLPGDNVKLERIYNTIQEAR